MTDDIMERSDVLGQETIRAMKEAAKEGWDFGLDGGNLCMNGHGLGMRMPLEDGDVHMGIIIRTGMEAVRRA